MYRTSSATPDDAIRAAHAAIAERARLQVRLREVESEGAAAELHVERLAAKLTREQRDVVQLKGGFWRLLYTLFADADARLQAEQNDVVVAAVMHFEAGFVQAQLVAEQARIAARIEALADAEADLARARATKEAQLLAGGGRYAERLETLAETLGVATASANELDEAMAAGMHVSASVAALAMCLQRLATFSNIGLAVDGEAVVSEAERLVGEVQRALALFRRELDDVVDTTLVSAYELPASGFGHLGEFWRFWMGPRLLNHAQAVTVAVARALERLQRERAMVHVRVAELERERERMLDG